MLLCTTGRILLGCLSTLLSQHSRWSLYLQSKFPWSSGGGGERKSYTDLDQVNREVVLVQWCSFQPGTAWCAAYSALLLFSLALIFDDNLPNCPFFMSHWLAIIVNSQPIIATRHLPTLLDVDLSPACWKPPHSQSHLSLPHDPLVPLKNTRVRNMVLSLCTCWSISSACDSFPQPDQKFQFYLFLGVHHLYFSSLSWTTWKREGVKKSIYIYVYMISES